MQYNSVREYFAAEYPDLVGSLDNSGGFWPAVKDNTIENSMLEANYKITLLTGDDGRVAQASRALAFGRLTGKVHNPG